MTDFLCDWASARSSCLTKALLDSVASNGATGFDIYYKYLETCMLFDTDLNFSALCRFGLTSKEIVSRYQFKATSPSEEPAHFSFFSQHDVNRLGSLQGLEIVIYTYDDCNYPGRLPSHLDRRFWKSHFETKNAAELARRRNRLTLFHDFRSLEVNKEGANPRAYYIVTCKAPRRLYRLFDDCDLDKHVRPWFSDGGRVIDARGPSGRVDFLSACDQSLSSHETPTISDVPVAEMASASDFLVINRPFLYDRWSQLYAEESKPGCFIVVAFCRLAGKSPLVRMNVSPPVANFRFTTLAVVSSRSGESGPDEADFVTPDTVVLCIFADRFVCQLSDAYRLGVAASHLHASGLKERLLNRSNLSGVPRVLSEDQKEQARQAAAERDQKSRLRRSRSYLKKVRPPRASDKIKKKCKCSDCRSETYSNNMSRAGPERLCSTPYSTRELLRLLGMLDAETSALVERLLELSIGAMDLESQTINLSMEGPRPGPHVVYPEIAGPVLEGHVKKVQRPIMIGHTDALSRERNERWRDTVADDSVEAVFNMFSRYWLRVTKLHRQAKTLKLRTAERLTEAIANYKRAFFAYSDRFAAESREERNVRHETERLELSQRHARGEIDDTAYDALLADLADEYHEWTIPDVKALAVAFRNLPPGLLARQLEKICNRYIVFSFYG